MFINIRWQVSLYFHTCNEGTLIVFTFSVTHHYPPILWFPSHLPVPYFYVIAPFYIIHEKNHAISVFLHLFTHTHTKTWRMFFIVHSLVGTQTGFVTWALWINTIKMSVHISLRIMELERFIKHCFCRTNYYRRVLAIMSGTSGLQQPLTAKVILKSSAAL